MDFLKSEMVKTILAWNRTCFVYSVLELGIVCKRNYYFFHKYRRMWWNSPQMFTQTEAILGEMVWDHVSDTLQGLTSEAWNWVNPRNKIVSNKGSKMRGAHYPFLCSYLKWNVRGGGVSRGLQIKLMEVNSRQQTWQKKVKDDVFLLVSQAYSD